ncbi:hypothetical protein [Hyalangium versicolor]|uniref:hypothetical protein n=1 Tax=Hyalangium versicolor TaxID=2861190 RepID=UPI001CCEDB34|nr:hypothetical protein [Hyalangium versicolor]
MTERREAPGRSPLALRLVHAAIFLAIVAGVVAAAVPEWRHGWFALGRPYHAGPPPRALLLLGSALATVGAAALLVALARGRSAPLGVSWLVLGGAGAVVLGAAGSPPRENPSELAINTRLIQLGQSVQTAMVGRLQERGEVPVALEPWQEALARAAPSESPIRTRTFQQVPPRVVRVETPEARPEPLIPGTLLLYVSPDGASFEIRLVGLSPQGLPQVLGDETGAPVVLQGLYNPDLPARIPLP